MSCGRRETEAIDQRLAGGGRNGIEGSSQVVYEDHSKRRRRQQQQPGHKACNRRLGLALAIYLLVALWK
ncbi:unnamed protein product [Calypogeia fissa]